MSRYNISRYTKTANANPIEMSKITLLLFVVALTMCIVSQTVLGAPTLNENEGEVVASCSNQGAHCKSNSDCCFYLHCDKYSKLCWP